MKLLSITCLTLCFASVVMVAQGQYGKSSSPYQQTQQRKMAPMPSSYGANTMEQYGQQEQASYGQPAQQQRYSAPSAASTSQYDERQQAPSYGAPAAPKSSGYGQQSQGYGKQQRAYEEPHYPPMPFAWGYDINDGYGGAQYHKESGDEYGKRTGSYGYTDAYGVYRQVDYIADEYGFRATIKTNEPGTANESPADVDLHAYEPPSNYYAGNTQSYGGGASSYGSSSQSYSKPAAASYSKPAASSYQAPKAASYRPPAQYSANNQGYSAPAPSYGRQQQPSYQPIQQQQQEYSSSVLVPVYQKATGATATAAAASAAAAPKVAARHA